jgi:prephenate dehydrogenase
MRIAIIGTGKMGFWLAKKLCDENTVAVYDTDKQKMHGLEECATVLKELSELRSYAPELLINAVSLQNTVVAFESATPYLPKDCIITDVASIKECLQQYYNKCGFNFASVHPMFGPTFADMNSLKEENAIIIKESEKSGAEFFRAFFSKLGIRIFEYTFEEHDQMMAYTLTTPFAASLVFAACMDKTVVPGTTFARHKKLAQGLLSEDDNLLAEILFNKYSLNQLAKITSRIEFLKHIISNKDYTEAKRFFNNLRKNVG